MEDAGMLAGGEIELFEQRPVPTSQSDGVTSFVCSMADSQLRGGAG